MSNLPMRSTRGKGTDGAHGSTPSCRCFQYGFSRTGIQAILAGKCRGVDEDQMRAWRPPESAQAQPTHLCHGALLSLACSPSREYDPGSLEYDQDIQPQRKVLDVIEIVLDLDTCLVGIAGIALHHLGPARDARPHDVAINVERNLGVELVHEYPLLGARADQAHVTLQHVPELGQLVQPRLADKGTHPRD